MPKTRQERYKAFQAFLDTTPRNLKHCVLGATKSDLKVLLGENKRFKVHIMAMHKAIDVARWFIAKAAQSGDLVTHLKVQKLLYYAEAWTSVILEKELFEEQMQAWAHGPVVPEVFREFTTYGWNPLPVPADQQVPQLAAEALEVLNQVYESYGDLPAKTLEEMTHLDQPWIEARGGLDPEARCEVVMPKNKIRDFFAEKYAA